MVAHHAPLSSSESAGICLAGAFAALFAVGLLSAQVEEQDKTVSESKALASLIAELRSRYPDFYRAVRAGPEIIELLTSAEAKAGSHEEALVRLLAAEILRASADVEGAKKVLEGLRRGDGPASDRARAAYRIGLESFLSAQYSTAANYWNVVSALDPASPWAQKVERYRPYMDMVRMKRVPAFSAQFSAADTPAREISLDSLKGRTVILHFWSSGNVAERPPFAALTRITRHGEAPEEKPAEKTIAVLGVNLDADREAFARAVKEWGPPRLEHHDGLVFEGPLVRSLGIPRTPHYLVIDPEGGVIYLGGSLARLERALFPPPGAAAPKSPGEAAPPAEPPAPADPAPPAEPAPRRKKDQPPSEKAAEKPPSGKDGSEKPPASKDGGEKPPSEKP